MGKEYSRELFREYLAYPDRDTLTLFQDRKRLGGIELSVMKWIQNNPLLVKKEFTLITKNWWTGAKQQAMMNMKRISRTQQEYEYLTGVSRRKP